MHLHWNEELLKNSTYFGISEGFKIFKLYHKNTNFYILVNEKKELMAYISVGDEINGYTQITNFENVVCVFGAGTVLIVGLIVYGMKFFMVPSFELSIYGLEWIKKCSERKLFKITNEIGEKPNLMLFRTENYNENSGMKIFIENNNIDIEEIKKDNEIWENKWGLLMPYYKYFHHILYL
jgi:hypothetical protein